MTSQPVQRAAPSRRCRAGWRRSRRGAAPSACGVDLQRVALDDSSAAGIGRGDLAERRRGSARSRSIATTRGALRQQRAGEPAGAGADLDRRAGVERRRRRARCGRVRLRSSRKCWPSALVAPPGRGARSPRAAAAARRRAESLRRAGCGSAMPAGHARARRSGSSDWRMPVPAMSSAVPWSGEVRTKGRPSVTLTPLVEGERLERDQRLVVIHADDRVVAGARGGVEHGIGRQRPASRRCRPRAAPRPPAPMIVDLLAAERAALRRHAG